MLTIPLSIRCNKCKRFCKRPIFNQEHYVTRNAIAVTQLYTGDIIGAGDISHVIGDGEYYIEGVIPGTSSCCNALVTLQAHRDCGWLVMEYAHQTAQMGQVLVTFKMKKFIK